MATGSRESGLVRSAREAGPGGGWGHLSCLDESYKQVWTEATAPHTRASRETGEDAQREATEPDTEGKGPDGGITVLKCGGQ